MSRLGVWFNESDLRKRTNTKLSVSAYVDIKNPYETTFDELWNAMSETSHEEFIEDLNGEGYDGITLEDAEFGGKSFVLLEPTQIKSATDNTGEFGPGADIRYSVVRGATEGVREALRHIADGEDHGVIHNAEYGDIEYPLGHTGRRGMGLAHIVESRMGKDGATLDEAIDVAIKVASAAESGRTTTERYNTKHLDKDGVRAIVAFMPDGSRIITGYEISADGRGGANRRSPKPESRPHVSLEGIVAALKSKLAIPPTPDIVAQSALSAQAPTPDAFVRDAVMGMLAAAEMMARLLVSLSEAVLSVAELERTPEETARREEELKKREEERAKESEGALAADADGYIPAMDEVEPTDEQKRRVAELLDRAKFASERTAATIIYKVEASRFLPRRGRVWAVDGAIVSEVAADGENVTSIGFWPIGGDGPV